jgi:hypothetical protein
MTRPDIISVSQLALVRAGFIGSRDMLVLRYRNAVQLCERDLDETSVALRQQLAPFLLQK